MEREIRKRISTLRYLFLAGGGGEETRSGIEKRCSHNLQSGHPVWWSADNKLQYFSHSKMILLDFLEGRSEPTEEIRNA